MPQVSGGHWGARLWRRHINDAVYVYWGRERPRSAASFRKRVKIRAVGGRDAAETDTPILSFNWLWSFEGEGKLLEDGRRHRRRA